jgi:hypothetical protein
LAEDGRFSGAVLVAKDGRSVYSGAWGGRPGCTCAEPD